MSEPRTGVCAACGEPRDGERCGVDGKAPACGARVSEAEYVDLVRRLRAFYSDADARKWLGLPHIDLGGTSPLDAVAAGRGAEVDAIIDRLESAAYV